MKRNPVVPDPSQAQSFPTFAELRAFFIYLTFVQPSIKAGMTRENKMYKGNAGIPWAESLEIVTAVGCRSRGCHCPGRGGWFWQQLSL